MTGAFKIVPEGFSFAGNDAEHVLDGESGSELLMGFELGQIDNPVGLQSYAADGDAKAGNTRKTNGLRMVEGPDLDAPSLELVEDSEGL